MSDKCKMPRVKDLKAIAKEYEIPLSKTEILWLLAKGKKGFPYENRIWKQKCQEIQDNYSVIQFHKIRGIRIGEYVPKFLELVEDSRENAKKGILDVLIITDWFRVNQKLAEIIGREMYVLNKYSAIFFVYYLKKTQLVLVKDNAYGSKYEERCNRRIVKSTETADLFQLSEKEKEEGRKKIEKTGIKTNYICIYSRDAAYLKSLDSKRDFSYHNYRDSDICKMKLTAEYFDTKNIQLVRMGKVVNKKISIRNCIDYASKFYDELLDIVLIKECKFFLGDAAGLCILPMMMNKPVALKNVVPVFSGGWGYHPQSKSNLYIFKKYYSEKDRRFLSLREMVEIDKIVGFDGHKYAELEISVVENSEEEILDLAIEMNARIDGTWVENEIDKILQNKFHEIFTEWITQENISTNTVLHCNVGTEFLKKNSFLLEDYE